MSKNKEFGFDILENSDINTIEDIGIEKMNMDKKEMDRILKNTMKKYEEQKQKQGITSHIHDETKEEADSVSGVEVYEQRHIPRIIYIALCSAAAIALVFGSISMLRRQKNITPDIKNPIAEVTSTATTANSVTSNSTNAVVTAEATNTKKATSTTIPKTTTTTDTTTTVYPAETTAENKPSDTAVSAPYANPHTDRTDITQEELEAAAVRAVKGLIRDNAEFQALNPQMEFTFSYAFHDVNADSVPELFINKMYVLRKQHMYVYDGKEYVPAHFNGHDFDGNEKVHEVAIDNVDVFTEKNIIGMLGHQGGAQSFILYMESDNTITPLHEYTLYRYYEEGRMTEENTSDNDLIMFKYFCDEYGSYERTELNWISYTGEDGKE